LTAGTAEGLQNTIKQVTDGALGGMGETTLTDYMNTILSTLDSD
jgi:hypothetical protein